jgi:hypothetical protein
MAVKINNKVYVSQRAVVTFGTDGAGYVDAALGSKKKYGNGTTGDHEFWGESDAKLYEMHDLVCNNPTKWPLITINRDFVIGKGLKVKSLVLDEETLSKFEVVEKQTPEANLVRGFLKRFRFDGLLRKLAMDLSFSGRYYVQIEIGTSGFIDSVKHVDVFHCRPRRMVVGERDISAYVLNPNFGTKRWRKADNVYLPAFNYENPTKYPVAILDIKEYKPGQVYNSFANWWGTKDWTRVSNVIPEFHIGGLNNGYNVKYHVSIPDTYFDGDDLDESQVEAEKQKVCDVIDTTLAGKKDSVLFTFHTIDVNGKEMSGVRVTPLKNEMNDDAFMKLFQMARTADTAAHNTLPILTGVDTGSKLGGSGAELEVAARYVQNYLTPGQRTDLLELLEVCRMLEGWSDEIVFEFENFEVYNFDVTPTGAKNNKLDETD